MLYQLLFSGLFQHDAGEVANQRTPPEGICVGVHSVKDKKRKGGGKENKL